VHPSPNFPGRTQENVLTQLLRKKLEPDVEELVSQGRDMSKMATPEGLAALQEVWEEARGWTQKRIAEYVRDEAGDVYSVAEREMGIEKVRTGLRRPLEEESDEDEDEDEDEEDEDGEGGSAEGRGSQQQGRAQSPPPPRGPEPETLFWFGARADFEVPPNVEYERKGTIYRGLQGVGMPPEAMQDVMQG
jgi:mediator of RNA polymerase II transcription subunit 8